MIGGDRLWACPPGRQPCPGASCGYHHRRRLGRSAPVPAAPYMHLADASNGRVVLPLLLWRRGSGRGGPSPFSMLRFVATCQRVAPPIYLACWLRTTTSSPCPSPPKEERETAPRSVSPDMRVRSSVLGRSRLRLAQHAGKFRGLTAPRRSCARGRAHSGGTAKMRAARTPAPHSGFPNTLELLIIRAA